MSETEVVKKMSELAGAFERMSWILEDIACLLDKDEANRVHEEEFEARGRPIFYTDQSA